MPHVDPQQMELWLGLKQHYIDIGISRGFHVPLQFLSATQPP